MIDDVVAGLGVGPVDVESVVTVEGRAEDGLFDFLIGMVVSPNLHDLAGAEGIGSSILSVKEFDPGNLRLKYLRFPHYYLL